MHSTIVAPTLRTSAAEHLTRLGITSRNELAQQDPDRLFSLVCRRDRVNYDPRLRDMIAAVIHVARGGTAKPWWEFTRERESFLRRLEAEMTRLRGPHHRARKSQILK